MLRLTFTDVVYVQLYPIIGIMVDLRPHILSTFYVIVPTSIATTFIILRWVNPEEVLHRSIVSDSLLAAHRNRALLALGCARRNRRGRRTTPPRVGRTTGRRAPVRTIQMNVTRSIR